MLFTTTAYNSQGQALASETQTDNWEAVEICLGMSEEFGYAEATDPMHTHMGEYGNRPAALGQRRYC